MKSIWQGYIAHVTLLLYHCMSGGHKQDSLVLSARDQREAGRNVEIRSGYH